MKKLLTSLVTGEMLPPPEQVSENPDHAASTSWFNPLRSSDFAISYVESSIDKASSSSVKIYALTETNETADDIGGMMTIQKWLNNK